MRITCEQCQANYTIADEKVIGRTVKIRCRKCGGDIVVSGAKQAAAAGGGLALGSTASAEASFQVSVGEGDERTMSLSEVLGALSSGVIDVECFVWGEGFTDWKPIREVDGIASQIPERESASIAITADQTASGVHEEPRAALLKRDNERSTRDLFGNPIEVEAAQPRSTRPPPKEMARPSEPPDGMTTGQRSENSVLFSLATLGPSMEIARTPPPPAMTAGAEDSGIIDIKALLPQHSEPRAIAPAVPVALFGPPVMEPSIATPAEEAKSSGPKVAIIAAAFTALAAAGGLIFWMQSSKPAPSPESATTASATATAPAPSAAASSQAPPPAETAATAQSAEPAAEAPAPKHPGKPSGGHTHRTPAPASTPSTTTKPATAKPASKGGCKCAGDDLMCQIRCSAGH